MTISRSGMDGGTTKDIVEELSRRGVEVTVHKGSVLDKAFLEKLKEQCKDYPIKGIIQGAMVLEDSRLEAMEYKQWRAAMEPKVYGSWNIHEVFGHSLDFFVLLSSIGGVIGSLGQGNYGAGNTFQDAIARSRAALGLPGNTKPDNLTFLLTSLRSFYQRRAGGGCRNLGGERGGGRFHETSRPKYVQA